MFTGDQELTLEIRTDEYARAYNSLAHMKGFRDVMYEEIEYLVNTLHDSDSAYFNAMNTLFYCSCKRINRLRWKETMRAGTE